MDINLNAYSDIPHVATGAYYEGTKETFEYHKKYLDTIKDKIINKRIVFMPGGVGRVANYALSLGVDAYSLDISEIYQEICHRNYPNVKTICDNMMNTHSGFDFVYLEDQRNASPLSKAFVHTVNNWQKYTKILPEVWTYKVVHFNSDWYKDQFSTFEPEGQMLLKKALKSGHVNAAFTPNEVEELEIETFEINLNAPINSFFHKQKKQFMGFLNGASSSDINKIAVRLYCADFDISYRSNKPIVLSPWNPDKVKKY